jgi:hypothetical protein
MPNKCKKCEVRTTCDESYCIYNRCKECLVQAMCKVNQCILIKDSIAYIKKWGYVEKYAKEYAKLILKRYEETSMINMLSKVERKKILYMNVGFQPRRNK